MPLRRRPPADRASGTAGPVARLLDGVEGPVLVLVASPAAYDRLPDLDRDDVQVRRTWEGQVAVDVPSVPLGAVVLVAGDRGELRTVVSGLGDLGRTTTVAVWLTAAPEPVLFVPHGQVPPVVELQARRLSKSVGGAFTSVEFGRPTGAHGVLVAMAHQSVRSADTAPGHLVVGYVDRAPLPGLDPGAARLVEARDAVDPERVVPLDVLVTSTAPGALPPHPVTGRAPLVVTDVGVEPVDELVHNPVGFVKVPDRPTLALPDEDGFRVTEAFVRRARRARTVSLDLTTASPQDVLRLAMSGIALEVTGTQPRFAPAVQAALAAPYDADDTLAREGWTLRLRRAVFDHHSTSAWRAGVAADAGVTRLRTATGGLPPVSVLLVTRRPHELEGAVRTVAAQVGAEIELVVATHGFRADPARVAQWLGREAVVLDFAEDVLFGDVLSAAAAAASTGLLMKMDDDDWYSPHAVHDLLMARRWSGADVVGMPAEFVHLQLDGVDETVRRNHPVERYAEFVAGGTLLLSAELLRDLGGFRPVRRWVDAQLLHAVRAAGGQIYRTHGLGYVLKRRAEGHTWDNAADNFRQPRWLERTWPGFRPPEEGA